MTASLAVAIGLSAMAAMAPAVAQEAPKGDAAPAATAEGTSDHGRHHRHKHDDAKTAEDAANTEPAAGADAGTKTPPVSTVDSSAVAAIKQPEQECRSVRPTGTRMSQKICATPEQWKEVDARGAEGARQTKQSISDSAAIARQAPPLP